MKVYYNKSFTGHYPIGTSAVIVASDKVQALRLLNIELKKHGLKELNMWDTPVADFVELDLRLPHCVVLQDGDY